MSIPESDIVRVTVSVSQAATTQSGFGLILLLGSSAVLPFGNRYGLYSDMTSVGAVFPTNSPEWIAANRVFSATPAPTQIMIARRFSGATNGELLGSFTPDKILTDYTGIANGSLSLAMDGVVKNVTGINLTGAASIPAVAALIQTALAALSAGATVIYSLGQFIIRSGTTGSASSVGFASAAPTGTDLATLLGVRSVDGGTSTVGAVAESISQSLTNIQALFGSWYYGYLVDAPTDQNIVDAATFGLANRKIIGYTTANSGAVNPNVTNDLGSILEAAGNGRVMGSFDLTGDPNVTLGTFALAATVDFNGTDTTQTTMFKKLTGTSVSPITEAMKQVLTTKNLNYYLSVGGNPMFMPGVMADGTWFDQVQGLDWLSSALGATVFDGFYGSKKVPQTDKGMATLQHRMEVVLNQGVNNGLLAPGIWNGANVGQITSGQRLAKGFYVFFASVDTQDQGTRNTRVGPPFSVIAKGAGALQGIDINLSFEQ